MLTYAWPDVFGMIRLSAVGTGLGALALGVPWVWCRVLDRETGRHLARNLPALHASAPSTSWGEVTK